MNTSTLAVSPLSSLPLVNDTIVPELTPAEKLVNALKDIGASDSVIGPKRTEFVAKCLRIVYANQTESERASAQTTVHNGRGFNGRDAGFATSLAKWAEKRTLSEKQVRSAAKMLRKYSRQILAGW